MLKQIINKYLIKETPVINLPTWNGVEKGDLKGVQLYVNNKMPSYFQMISGEYDSFFWNYIKDNICVENTLILDIGAHIGYDSLYFSSLVGVKGRVFSFEPNSFNIDRMKLILSKNEELAKRIEIFNTAVSDKSDVLMFNLSEDIDNQYSCGGHINGADVPLSSEVYRNLGFVEKEVSAITLDDFAKVQDFSNLSLIKIDVEGAEYLVLLGAKEIIKKFKPTFLIEIHSIKSMFDVYRFFGEVDYRIDFIFQESNGIGYISAKSN